MTSNWTARYPDLHGKTMVVAGESSYLFEVSQALAGNGALLAIVAPDQDLVARAVRMAEGADAAVFGLTADPSSAAVWERIAPHIEQRLGPIDVAVAIATAPTRQVICAALLPDMTARGRGVLIEAGTDVPTRPTSHGVRHRSIQGRLTADEVAAAVLFCASDTVLTPALTLAMAEAAG